MEIAPEPCDWREFEEKHRRKGNSISEKDGAGSDSTEPASSPQDVSISISSDEESTTDAREEISGQNRDGSKSHQVSTYSTMSPYQGESTVTAQNLPSETNTKMLIIHGPRETAFSENPLTKIQNQIKKVNTEISTSSFSIFCPTYSVNPASIYQNTSGQFPFQSPINLEISKSPQNRRSYKRIAPAVHTYPPPSTNSDGKLYPPLQTETCIPPRESCGKYTTNCGVPRRKYKRQTTDSVRHSAKDLIQDLEKNIAVVRPTNRNKSLQSPTLRTTSVMSGIREGVLGSEINCFFRNSCSNSPEASCSLREFSLHCPKCITLAKEMAPLIKRLTAVADTPSDLVNILELKRLLIEMDSQNFTAIMLKLLQIFPKEMIQHITT